MKQIFSLTTLVVLASLRLCGAQKAPQAGFVIVNASSVSGKAIILIDGKDLLGAD